MIRRSIGLWKIALQFTPKIDQDPNGKSDEDEEIDQEVDKHIDENDREFSDEEYVDLAEYDKEFEFMYQ